MAVENKRKVRENWIESKSAGPDWAQSFLKRHPDISIRKPEPTSIQRLTNFNRHNVDQFFNNLEAAMAKLGTVGADEVWNVAETGVTTVQRPPGVLAERGTKQVGSAVAQEKGTLVTLCCAVNAMGNHVPPFFVFPRVKVQENWLLTAPPGSQATGHPKATGWMTGENFLKFMEHFVKFVNPTPEKPVILLLDNHASHVSLPVIKYAKEHNITLLSFPPHCSHELQPLDKSVYGPLKTFYNARAASWARSNGGKSMTIHHIPLLIAHAFPKAMTPVNITAGFRSTGIFPFDRHIFPDEKFLGNFATSRELPVTPPVSVPSTSASGSQTTAENSNPPVTPEMIRPLPKRSPRKASELGKPTRRKAKSEILTSTPVKKALEDLAESRKQPKAKRRKLKMDVVDDESSVDSGPDQLCDDSSDHSDDEDTARSKPQLEDLTVDDHILVQFPGKTSCRYYVGRIVSVPANDDEIQTTFMRRQTKTCKADTVQFFPPENEDMGCHPVEDVVLKLPVPTKGPTKRSSHLYDFHCYELEKYKIE